MIIDERLLTFINSMSDESDVSDCLKEIEKEALSTEVPIIRKDMQTFLRVLLKISRPKKILEVGAAVGFSAIMMAENTDKDCEITTIENWPPRIPIAKSNFIRAGFENKITLLEGDAGEILPSLASEGKVYDLIFMDAAKGQYPIILPDVLKMLRPGGILLTDNVLLEGDLIESKYAIVRRDRTIHKRMREYLFELTHNKELKTTILPVGDGVALTVKEG